MIKATVALAIAGGVLAGMTGLPTAALFAERAAEYDATAAGLVMARTAHEAAPDDARLERTYASLSRHCLNLVAAYNIGAELAPDDFADAGLTDSLDAAACE